MSGTHVSRIFTFFIFSTLHTSMPPLNCNRIHVFVLLLFEHTHTHKHTYTHPQKKQTKEENRLFTPKLNEIQVGNLQRKEKLENSTNGTPLLVYLFIYVAHLEKKVVLKILHHAHKAMLCLINISISVPFYGRTGVVTWIVMVLLIDRIWKKNEKWNNDPITINKTLI